MESHFSSVTLPGLQPSTVQLLQQAGLPISEISAICGHALAEDLGGLPGADITAKALFGPHHHSVADVVAREPGIIAGLPVAAAVADIGGDGRLKLALAVADGQKVTAGQIVATVSGPTYDIVATERTILNFLSHLSGIATHTFAWAQAIAHTSAQVLDTRKTTPGLRLVDKYAVRCGGGTNKRLGLYDVAMIKDNHSDAVGGVEQAYRQVRDAVGDTVAIQVEVATPDEAMRAIAAGARFLLCDNMPPDVLQETVKQVRRQAGNEVELEATGGLHLAIAAVYAETGVDYLSVGALTHSSPIIDIALDIRK